MGPREVNNVTPVVLAMDVTRSRGDDTKRLYEQLPTLMKRMEERAYIEGPGISFAAVGDATSDKAPLQVSQFEGDNRMDAAITAMWIEEGGGGTGQESYELAAWYYAATNCVRLAAGTGRKGFFFFVGDEGFYPVVHGAHREAVLGQEAVDVDAAEAFRLLQEKFHVFLVYPGKPMEDRRADIDAEIRRRVISAGGQYDNVDVRVTLIWDNTNDLDLYVLTPGGERIFFGHRTSQCGGALDVDRNVQGETNTPVENIRWPKGSAPDGVYKVFVRNYRFHEAEQKPTPFRVEVEVDGDLLMFEGTASPRKQTGEESELEVATFRFASDPEARAEAYNAYSDEVVLAQWAKVLPEGHVLKLRDARSITSVLLGTLGIANGKETLPSYLARLTADGEPEETVADVGAALSGCRVVHG